MMAGVDSWDITGPEHLRQMQALASRLWSPTSWWHPGGLAWSSAAAVRLRVGWDGRVWGSPDRPVAWAWASGAGELVAQVDPEHRELAGEVIAWFETESCCRAQPSFSVEVAAGDVLEDALLGAGYSTSDAAPFGLDMRRSPDGVGPPDVAEGYVVRSIEPDELPARVEVHRAAWRPADLPYAEAARWEPDPEATSSLSVAKYLAVTETWPYRMDLDLVAVAPDGTFAACCIVWLDESTGAAEIEPVGTHPRHRGLHLAEALCSEATRRVGALGGTELTIHPRGDQAYPVPRKVYARCGFEPVHRTRTYGRSA